MKHLFLFQSALTVAFLNVYIPAMLGVIVNVLAGMRTNLTADFMDEIKMPALKLVSLYIGQVICWFYFLFTSPLSIS